MRVAEEAKVPSLRVEALLEAMQKCPVGLARLHRIKLALPSLAMPSAAEKARLLQAFPDGWLRRRVLQALIAAGQVASLAEAVPLIEALGTEWDRLECLLRLAQRGLLAHQEEDLVLSLVHTRTARLRAESLCRMSEARQHARAMAAHRTSGA